MYGIGCVKVETAGEKGGMQATGVLTLIISRLYSSSSEENIEGIRFHEELKRFILKEMRGFGKAPHVSRGRRVTSKGLFTERTLRAFQDVRDALRTEAQR